MALETIQAAATKVGTGWTIDVTSCNLSPNLAEKDFVVLDSALGTSFDNADFTKTSQTIITYNGTAIASTDIVVRRDTDVARYQEEQFGSLISTVAYNQELDKLWRKVAEFSTYGTDVSAITPATVSNAAYGVGWNGSGNTAASQNAIYDKVETLAPLDSPPLTGTPTAPTAAADTNTTQLATTQYVQTELTDYAPLASPSLSGTPTAPTPATATDTTQIATTAFVQAIKESLHPVGSIYINATDSTNPATLLGFGTWAAFGAGRVPVGFDAGDTDFNTAEKTGGAKTHTLTESELPSHTHGVTDPGHNHTMTVTRTVTGGGTDANHVTSNGTGIGPQNYTNNAVGTGVTVNAAGGGSAHNNVQPYITVYMWKRTA